MSTHQQTLEWIRKLGYDGEFPSSFDKVCNNSTSFIWDQLIYNVRSKIEVDNIKTNILVNQLKQNGISFSQPYASQCSSEEINIYLKKKDLEQKVEKINYSINQKQAMNDSLIKQNSIKQFHIEKLNLQIKENEEREFLLREKLKTLGLHLQEADNILSFSTTCAPAEVKETNNLNEITHTLNQCGKTLEDKVKQLPLLEKNISGGVTYRPFLSAQKSVRKNITFEHYFCLTEKQTAKKIKKIVKNTKASSANKVNKRLFSEEKMRTKPNKLIDLSNRRESLEMHVEDNEDENFLVNISKASFVPPLSDLQQSCSVITMQDINKTNINGQSTNEFMFKMLDQDLITSDITNLLYKYNPLSISNIIKFLIDDIHFDISKKINFKDVQNSSDGKHNSMELTKLQALHVKTEFKLIKNNIVLRQQMEKLIKKNESLFCSLLNSGYSSELVNSLQKKLQLIEEDTGLDCLLTVIKSEINDIQTNSKMTHIHNLNKSLKDIKEEIASKKTELGQYFTLIQEMFSAINHIRSASYACVREVAPFTSDLTWSYLLEESINAKEIKVFEQFPLEYNRKFINTNPHLCYRDFHTDKYLLNQEVNNENFDMLSCILDNPFSHPETIISNILCSKLKLELLKNIKPVENKKSFKKYSFKDLKSTESTERAVEEFNKMISSSTSKKILSAANVSTNVMNILNEMNFDQFISPKIKVDGKDYQHFQIMYDRFFSGL